MAVPSILLIGNQAVDMQGLLSAIVGRPLDPSALSAPWTIDNKYYSAQVRLQIAHLEADGEGEQLASQQEAVLLVFDAARHETFASLREWWEQQQADPAVKLAVAAGTAQAETVSGAEAAQWLLDAQEWCAEQLIEYVEVPEEQPGSSRLQQAEARAGGEAGEEVEGEGVQRVVEALHAHTWPGLQLKPRSGGGGPSMTAALAATLGPRQEAAQESAISVQLSGGPGSAGEQHGNGLDQLEDQAEEMDLLFAELAGARDQLRQMGDAERREAAASLMLRLMGALGLEDDADGEASSEEEGQASAGAAEQ